MRTQNLTNRTAGALLACAVALGLGSVQAQPRHDERRPGFDHYDARFNHNHYYPGRGYVVHDLPRDRIVVTGPHGRFFYSGGIWYAPRGPGFVVVGAPIGVFVPGLPFYYTTVWVGGFPYYYANDTYYAWRPSAGEYEVVAPPDEQAASTEPPPAPPSQNGDVYVYPKNGQPEDQQANDKYECHKWAQGESGFDPTQVNGGTPPDQASLKRDAYQHAMAACLEGRGYSVK